jgi:hypothetical protein
MCPSECSEEVESGRQNHGAGERLERGRNHSRHCTLPHARASTYGDGNEIRRCIVRSPASSVQDMARRNAYGWLLRTANGLEQPVGHGSGRSQRNCGHNGEVLQWAIETPWPEP